MQVHILSGVFEYESSIPIAVFSDRNTAETMKRELEKYNTSEPDIGTSEESCRAWNVWKDSCPLKDAGGFDRYALRTLPVN